MALIPTIVPKPRQWGLLLDAADEMPVEGVHWREGVSFFPLGVIPASGKAAQMCFDGEDPDEQVHDWTGGEGIDLPQFKPFTIYDLEDCSALDVDADEMKYRTQERVRLSRSSQVTAELISGALSGGTSLADAPAESPATVQSIFGLVESFAPSLLGDAQGLVMFPPPLAPIAANSGVIERVGDAWLTLSGHRVVIDPGHIATPSGGNVYLTGPIQVHIGEDRFSMPHAVEYLDRTRNIVTGRTEREAIFAYDPATAVRFPFTWS